MGYLASLLGAALVERLAVDGTAEPAFFWPVAGIATLWLLSGRTRAQVAFDGAVIVLGTAVIDVLLGVDLVPAVLLGLANTTTGLTVRRAWTLAEGKPMWGPVTRRLAGSRDLSNLGIASVAAGVASAIPGLLAVLAESGSLTWETAALWIVRGACSTFVGASCVLALLTAVFRAHAKRGLGAIFTASPRRHWTLELVAIALISLASAGVIFGSNARGSDGPAAP